MSDVFGIDLSSVSAEERMSGAMPAGEYTVMIDEAKMMETKAKDGYYLKIKLKVCDMEKRNGAVAYDIVNVKNKSKQAEEIGKGRLKRLLELAGVKESDMAKAGPQDLIGKKYNVYLTVQKQAGYNDQNRVASYSKANKGLQVSPEANGSTNMPAWT